MGILSNWESNSCQSLLTISKTCCIVAGWPPQQLDGEPLEGADFEDEKPEDRLAAKAFGSIP
jgi:hypothetical protein